MLDEPANTLLSNKIKIEEMEQIASIINRAYPRKTGINRELISVLPAEKKSLVYIGEKKSLLGKALMAGEYCIGQYHVTVTLPPVS